MNHKHIAVVIVALLIGALVQITLWMQKRLQTLQDEESSARAAAEKSSALLIQERKSLGDLRRSSSDLIQFLQAWEPYFGSVNSPQSAEVSISLQIKEAGLLTLSQRFELVPRQNDSTIPRIMRAHLTMEDDYAGTLNWLGTLESRIPTARISNIKLTKGQLANDIRMDLVIEVPLATPAQP